MNPLIAQLEQTMQSQIADHRALLVAVSQQRDAMKALDLGAMDEASRRQQQIRQRLTVMEARRRMLTEQLARSLRLAGVPTVSAIAASLPAHSGKLVALRDELRGLIEQIRVDTQIATRVAGAVMGHLNTVVRLIGSAVQHAGVYTRSGSPKVGGRVGVMEAVG